MLSISHLKRKLNRVLVETEYRLGRTYVLGHPYILFVDTLNVCNLHCPLCPTGVGMNGRKKGAMTKEVFERVLKELGPYAIEMFLYNWGEPLLHPDTFFFIREAEELGIRTILSSNMNVLDEEKCREMIRSGLQRLIISMDGVTSEAYRTYRIGGNLEEVKKNVKLLTRMKDRLGSTRPHTILQFLVFRHNEHEVSGVKDLAAELGVDDVEIMGGYLGGEGHTPYTEHPETQELREKWLSRNPAYRGEFDYFREDGYLCDNRCHFLWRTLVVNWDGSLTPCCCVYDEKADFGNLMEEPFSKVWNNPKYRSARAIFGPGSSPERVSTICSTCKIYRPYHL